MLQVAVDSVAVDTLATGGARDSTGVFAQLEDDITEASDLLLSGALGESTSVLLDGLTGFVITQGPRILGGVLIFILLYGLYRVVFWLLRRGLRRSSVVRPGLETLAMQGFRLVSLPLIGITILGHLNVNLAGLGLGLGLAGVAVGFAARDTLENIISGVTILLDQPFKIGDKIITQGVYGTVTEITLRSTRIRTPNNEVLVMPNIQMVNSQLINHTMVSPLRVDIPFSIAYKERSQDARKVVLKLTQDDKRLHPDHPPAVKVLTLNESSIDMRLWLFIISSDYEQAVQYDYAEWIREALREAGIEIPFPHVQLKLDEPVPRVPPGRV